MGSFSQFTIKFYISYSHIPLFDVLNKKPCLRNCNNFFFLIYLGGIGPFITINVTWLTTIGFWLWKAVWMKLPIKILVVKSLRLLLSMCEDDGCLFSSSIIYFLYYSRPPVTSIPRPLSSQWSVWWQDFGPALSSWWDVWRMEMMSYNKPSVTRMRTRCRPSREETRKLTRRSKHLF